MFSNWSENKQRLTLSFKQLGEEHSAELTAADDANLEVLFQLYEATLGLVDLLALLLALELVREELELVAEEFVVDVGQEDALKHEHIAHHFGGYESVLHLFVRDEVVQPIFAELRHTLHRKRAVLACEVRCGRGNIARFIFFVSGPCLRGVDVALHHSDVLVRLGHWRGDLSTSKVLD